MKKKKVVILGSTGSVGTSTLKVIKKNLPNFEIVLISANKSYKKLIQQAKFFKVKNVHIKDKKYFNIVKKKLKKEKTKVYSGEISLNKIIKSKIDYTMSSIVGIAGLKPTIEAIKFSKDIAIANKESIICGWNLISKNLKKYKTNLIPVDSEHFSIMELTKNCSNEEIDEIIITASGGPFLNKSLNEIRKATPKQAIRHPRWSMGKKISIDSANLMNKVFEIIEASKLFKFDIEKYRIMIHPQSYVHSIIKFSNGLTKMVLHDTDMKIPISNSIYRFKNNFLKKRKLNTEFLTNLSFSDVEKQKFPAIKLYKKFLNAGEMGPTILNASNEILVDLFLKKQISFLEIVEILNKVFKTKEFKKYASKKPKKLSDIYTVDKWARLKTKLISVR